MLDNFVSNWNDDAGNYLGDDSMSTIDNKTKKNTASIHMVIGLSIRRWWWTMFTPYWFLIANYRFWCNSWKIKGGGLLQIFINFLFFQMSIIKNHRKGRKCKNEELLI